MTFSPVVSFTLGTLSRSSLTLLRPPRLAAPSSSASSSLGAVILTPGITPEEALPVWLLVKPRGSKIGRLSPRIRGSESPSSSPGEVILGAEEGGRGNGDDIFWTRGPSNDCLESSKWRGQEKVDLGSYGARQTFQTYNRPRCAFVDEARSQVAGRDSIKSAFGDTRFQS